MKASNQSGSTQGDSRDSRNLGSVPSSEDERSTTGGNRGDHAIGQRASQNRAEDSANRTAGGSRGGTEGPSIRGFAAMNPEEQRRIASKGGRAAHLSGNAHEFTSAEAAEAGRKGAQARSEANNSRNASIDRDNKGTRNDGPTDNGGSDARRSGSESNRS